MSAQFLVRGKSLHHPFPSHRMWGETPAELNWTRILILNKSYLLPAYFKHYKVKSLSQNGFCITAVTGPCSCFSCVKDMTLVCCAVFWSCLCLFFATVCLCVRLSAIHIPSVCAHVCIVLCSPSVCFTYCVLYVFVILVTLYDEVSIRPTVVTWLHKKKK